MKNSLKAGTDILKSMQTAVTVRVLTHGLLINIRSSMGLFSRWQNGDICLTFPKTYALPFLCKMSPKAYFLGKVRKYFKLSSAENLPSIISVKFKSERVYKPSSGLATWVQRRLTSPRNDNIAETTLSQHCVFAVLDYTIASDKASSSTKTFNMIVPGPQIAAVTRCVLPGPRMSIVPGNCVRETSVKRRNKIMQEITRQ